jgi:hypothetical protein
MRRLFWIALGAVVGILVVRKVQKVAQSYTPAGLAERAGGLGASIRYFADEVRAGMAERELELRDALGLDEGHHEMPPDEAAQLIEHPTRHRRSAG